MSFEAAGHRSCERRVWPLCAVRQLTPVEFALTFTPDATTPAAHAA